MFRDKIADGGGMRWDVRGHEVCRGDERDWKWMFVCEVLVCARSREDGKELLRATMTRRKGKKVGVVG